MHSLLTPLGVFPAGVWRAVLDALLASESDDTVDIHIAIVTALRIGEASHELLQLVNSAGGFWKNVFLHDGGIRPAPSLPGDIDTGDSYAIEWRDAVKENFVMVDELMSMLPTRRLALGHAEIREAERLHAFKFPPDVRFVLRRGAPGSWHDYSRGCSRKDRANVRNVVEWHALPEGSWDRYPHDKPLAPIYAHRMIPTYPHEYGNPVYSMHQDCSDCIVYGVDLWTYIEGEHLSRRRIVPDSWRRSSAKSIPFWDKFI